MASVDNSVLDKLPLQSEYLHRRKDSVANWREPAMPAETRIGMKGEHNLDEVRMVFYQREDDRAYPLFTGALDQILAEKTAGGVA